MKLTTKEFNTYFFLSCKIKFFVYSTLTWIIAPEKKNLIHKKIINTFYFLKLNLKVEGRLTPSHKQSRGEVACYNIKKYLIWLLENNAFDDLVIPIVSPVKKVLFAFILLVKFTRERGDIGLFLKF